MNKIRRKFIPKKILLVVPNFASFTNPTKEALDKIDIKSELFDNRKTILREKIIFVLSLAVPSLYDIATRMINKRLIEKVRDYNPDLVLVFKGENLQEETIKNIAKRCPIVNWYPDYLRDPKRIKKYLGAYNLFFTGDDYENQLFRSKNFKNSHYLPYAGPQLNRITQDKVHDLVFIGSYSKEREHILLPLNKLNLKIWGDKNWKQSQLKDCYMGKWLSFEEALNILKKTKITVNSHRNSEKFNTVLNVRVYEATACGALLITDERKNLGKMFKVGKELVTYKDRSDLVKKVKKYLSNEKQRKAIAYAGYLRLNKDHTYERRLTELFSIISKSKSF